MLKRLLAPLKDPPGRKQTSRRNKDAPAGGVELQTWPAPGEGRPQEWAAIVSAIIHRFSQPLTALRGSLELALLTEGSAADYRLALKESLAQADNLVRLIGSLRELVEAEDSSEPAERTPLDQVVKEVSDDFEPLARSRGLTLALESKGNLYVHASPRWVRQAIYKVIHAALERSPERGTVVVSLSRSGQDACLAVTDQGPASRPGELDHLSEASSPVQTFSEASKRGTLEWAIAKRIFEIQGATVSVESVFGGGCSFTACFRLASSKVSDSDAGLIEPTLPAVTHHPHS